MSSKVILLRELHNGKFNSVGELYSAVKLIYDKHGDAEFTNIVEFYGSVMIKDSATGSVANNKVSKEGFVWE